MLTSFQLAAAVAAVAFYLIRFFLYKKSKTSAANLSEARYFTPTKNASDEEKRDFTELLKDQGKRLIFFYGSQTGTSEGYARRLAKEVKTRYGLSSLVCDPREYDFNVLDKVPSDSLVAFVLSTYGEGEPTDNAISLVESLKPEELELSEGGSDLRTLRYCIFGIGSSNYKNFNTTARQVDDRLAAHGATRIGPYGQGDENKVLEEDYTVWKETLWPALENKMGWQQGNNADSVDFACTEMQPPLDNGHIYLGELSKRALFGTRGLHDSKNPYVSPITKVFELFQNGDRNCIFAEFDIAESGMTYEAGDHVGVWPINSDADVDKVLRILGLDDKRHSVIDIKSLDPGLAKVPFPVPTTYDSVFRHYLDISQIASQHVLGVLARFGPTPKAKAYLEDISKDTASYTAAVVQRCLKLGEVLDLAIDDTSTMAKTSGTVWNVPFEHIVATIPRLQPRYYSISSSPRMYPNSIHVTAVVVKEQPYPGSKTVYGLLTSYLQNIKRTVAGESPTTDLFHPTHKLEGPRGKYSLNDHYATPIHTRQSKFRLPKSVRIPVIMIGPGTGVAPFRAFIQERVALARQAKQASGLDAIKGWGTMDLFYGCRRSDHDFLFKDEWDEYSKELDGKFTLHVAFSREPDQPKLYVQDLLRMQEAIVKASLLDKKGHVYICGDARNMARGVETVLEDILGKLKGGTRADGVKELNLLVEKKRLMKDVW